CGLIRATELPPSRGGEKAQLNAARGRPGADVVVPARCRSAARCHALRHLQRARGRGLPRMWPCPGYASVPVRPGTPGPRGRFYELRITNYELRITNHESRITNHESRITNHPNAKRRPEGSPFAWVHW